MIFTTQLRDSGIAIGEALKKALKKSVGIRRYAHAMIPMDETLSRVAIDISNRPYLIWKVNLKVEKLGEMDTELFKEWFQAFSQAAGITYTLKIFMVIIVTTLLNLALKD